MTDVNNSTRQLIKKYCNLSIVPEYALLIKGNWGCGKTHFVDDVIDQLKTDNPNLKFLKVSLYGVSSTNDIETKFFQQLCPRLSSKKMVFAGQVAKGFLKGALKIDLDGDGTSDGTVRSNLPDIDLQKYFTETKNCILVFDDLERCVIDLSEVLGYINYFVEKDGYKVLLLADEDKLIGTSNSQSSTSQDSYQFIKEKLIGKTVEVKADVSRVYQNLIQSIVPDFIKGLFEAHKLDVIKVFEQSGYQNLRSLRKCLIELKEWVESFESDVKEKPELLAHFFSLFTMLSMEIYSGNVRSNQIMELIGGFEYMPMVDEDDPEFDRLNDCELTAA